MSKIGNYARQKLDKIIADQGGGGGGGGDGDVTGPGSSTNDAITRFDGSGGKTLQNSGCTIDDSNNMTVAGDLTVSGGDTTLTAANDAAASILMQADNSDDAGDDWKIIANADQTFTIGNDIASAGSYVTHLTVTPNATIGDSLVTVAGILKLGGNEIQASDGGAALTLDTSDNVTVGGDLTVTGGDVTVGAAGNTTATTIGVVTNTGTNVGKALTIAAGSSTTGANNINGGDLILASGGGDGTGTSSVQFKTKVNGTDAAAERMRIHTDGNVGIGDTAPGTLLQAKGAAPYLTLQNSTSENSAGGCESKIIFEDHGNNALGQIEVSHVGSSDDEKGQLILRTNNDSGLQAALTISEAQNITIAGDLTISGDDLYMNTNTNRYILVADGTNYNPESADAIGADTGIIIPGQMFSH